MTGDSAPDDLWSRALERIAELVRGDYVAAARGGPCAPDDLRRTVTQYGRTLVALPATARDVAHGVLRRDGSWVVDVPLWTSEEGRSDLEVRLDAQRDANGWTVVVEDVLVP